MTEILDSLRSNYRNALIIGTSPFTEAATWKELVPVLENIGRTDARLDVIAESDTQLFQHSLRTDTPYATRGEPRVAFQQLLGRRSLLLGEVQKAAMSGARTTSLISTIPLPLYVARVDQALWYLPVTGEADQLSAFKKVSPGDPWYQLVASYAERLTDRNRDGRYMANRGSELLELFDQRHIPRGIYPRDCFYDTDHYQYVVWTFVFSRGGELLIHKRSENAKDNQSMWDKSVGGHIDFNLDRSTAVAATRELIQELYTKEQKQQTGHAFSLLSEDPSQIHFLGDWRPNNRGPEYLNQIAVLERESKAGHEPWVQYQVASQLEHNSPRTLPDGSQRRLRVLADVFIVIANTLLTQETARRGLQNSEYLLLEPAVIKTWIDNGQNDRGEAFKATPDLEFIMTGKLRDVLEEASQLIRYSEMRR